MKKEEKFINFLIGYLIKIFSFLTFFGALLIIFMALQNYRAINNISIYNVIEINNDFVIAENIENKEQIKVNIYVNCKNINIGKFFKYGHSKFNQNINLGFTAFEFQSKSDTGIEDLCK